VLRDLAAAKNRAFREQMMGREVSAVTLEPLGLALTDNFVKASLDMPYAANRLVRLRVRGLTEAGVATQVLYEERSDSGCS
jgi:hypothetical protein